MASTNTFQGWLGLDSSSVGKLVEGSYEVKPFTDDDVEIEITHCGVCGSDLHVLRSGWGQTDYPVVVGHEIVGKAVRVGNNITHVKVGDRVGVGAQSGSCLRAECEECTHDNHQYCTQKMDTYNARYPDGSKAYGGYADLSRVPGAFVIQLSDISLPSEELAPMLCGGATMYSPLKRHGCAPGKRVGIIGLGGLGHFGVLFARALGADKVVAISRRASKREDALALGADDYIPTADDPDWAAKNARSLDLIVSTVSSPNMPLTEYLGLLTVGGTFVQVGAPDDKLPALNAFELIGKGLKVAGSLIAPPTEIREMVELADKRKLKAWVNLYPLTKVNQALKDFEAGKPRYRLVLVNGKNAGEEAVKE